MAESVECDTSEKLETDKTLSTTTDKTLDFESNSNLSLSQEGSVVSNNFLININFHEHLTFYFSYVSLPVTSSKVFYVFAFN